MRQDPFVKAMFGCYSMQVPINIIVQKHNDIVCSIIGQSNSILAYGSKMTHQLIMGDAVIRPHAIIESNAFRGYGSAGLMCMDYREWLEKENNIMLLNGIKKEEVEKRLGIRKD